MPGCAVAWFDVADTDLAGLENEHEARMRMHEARVAIELSRMGAAGPARGIARPVYRSDGEYYPSVSEAARRNAGARADYICQAIRWGRKCRGYGWAYVDDVPADFWEAFIALNPGLSEPWPWRRNPLGCESDFKPNEVNYAAAG